MRPRFSLRRLFILAAIVAVCCYWLVKPTNVANRFISSVQELSFATVNDFMNKNGHLVADWRRQNMTIEVKASLRPWRLADLLRGERRVVLDISYLQVGEGSGGQMLRDVTATPFGLKPSPN